MIIDACVGNIVTFYVIDEQIHLASGAVLMLCSLLSMYIKLLFAFLGPQETLKTPRSDGDSMHYQCITNDYQYILGSCSSYSLAMAISHGICGVPTLVHAGEVLLLRSHWYDGMVTMVMCF